MPWNWIPAAALVVAVGAEAPEAEVLPLVRAPVEVPVAEAPAVPVAEPEVAVAVTKPEEVELEVTLEMSVENQSAKCTIVYHEGSRSQQSNRQKNVYSGAFVCIDDDREEILTNFVASGIANIGVELQG